MLSNMLAMKRLSTLNDGNEKGYLANGMKLALLRDTLERAAEAKSYQYQRRARNWIIISTIVDRKLLY